MDEIDIHTPKGREALRQRILAEGARLGFDLTKPEGWRAMRRAEARQSAEDEPRKVPGNG